MGEKTLEQSVQYGVQEDEFGVGGYEVDWMKRALMGRNQRSHLRVIEESCVILDKSPKPWP